MDVRVGLWRRLSAEELMLLNCGVGEDSWESLGLQGYLTVRARDQSWVFIVGTDAKAETPVLWPPHAKSWLFGKDPDAGRDWWQEEKAITEDEMTHCITYLMDMSLSELRELVMPTHGLQTSQPSHPLSSPSPPAPNPSQHQSLFQWVNSEFQLLNEKGMIDSYYIAIVVEKIDLYNNYHWKLNHSVNNWQGTF